MSFCPYYTLYDAQQRMDPSVIAGQTTKNFYIDMLRTTALGQGDVIHRIRPEAVYYDNKKPIYKLYPAIGEALLTTKIDIPVSEINLPFDSFVISLHRDLRIPLFGIAELCSVMVNMYTPKGKGMSGLRTPVSKGSQESRELAINYQIRVKQDLLTPQARRELELRPEAPYPTYDDQLVDMDSYYIEFPLIEGQNIEQCYQQYVTNEGIVERNRQPLHEANMKVLRLALGCIFLAISYDKKYVKRTVTKIRGNDQCFCGSGKKYKKCCGLKGIQNVGYEIGKDIVLAKDPKPSSSVVIEGRGKELQYGHLRSGHMRWQWYNDERGARKRKLIFIHPALVRPDLPLKPQLTPRHVRKPPRRYNPDNYERSLERAWQQGNTEAGYQLGKQYLKTGRIIVPTTYNDAWQLYHLEKYDVVAIPALAAALHTDDSWEVRESAAWLLGKIGDNHAVPDLIKAMQHDEKFQVRGHAAMALAAINDAEAVPALIETMQQDPAWEVRLEAGRSLIRIGDARADQALVETALRDEYWAVKTELAKLLEGNPAYTWFWSSVLGEVNTRAYIREHHPEFYQDNPSKQSIASGINAIISKLPIGGSKVWPIKNKRNSTLLYWSNSTASWSLGKSVEAYCRYWHQTPPLELSVDTIVVPYPRKDVKAVMQSDNPEKRLLPHPGYAASFEYKERVLGYAPISGFTITSDEEAKYLLDINNVQLEELRKVRDSTTRNLFQNYLLAQFGEQAVTHPAFLQRMENWVG